MLIQKGIKLVLDLMLWSMSLRALLIQKGIKLETKDELVGTLV